MNFFVPGAVLSGGQLTISVHTLTTLPTISETAETTGKKNEIRIRKRIRIEESGSDLTFKVLFYILLVIEQCISYVRDVY